MHSSSPPRSESVTDERALTHDFYEPHPNDNFSEETRRVDVVRQDATATEVFLAWEKLRLVYNGVLILCSLVLGVLCGTITDLEFFALCMIGAVVMNVCYCLGPVLEGYLVWMLRADRITSRAVVFIGGLALSLLSVSVAVAAVGGGF